MKDKVTPAKTSIREPHMHGHGEAAVHSGEAEKEVKKHLPKPDAKKLPRAASPSKPVAGGSGFASIVSQETYKTLFPNSNHLYTYEGLIAATHAFPHFCNEGSAQENRREAAAFLANISHETGALVFVDEQNPPTIYCDRSDATYPCAPEHSYHGRGPLQLSWNFNYGACGRAIGKDLLNHPELVSTTSNAAAGPFSTQPSGPRPVGCFSALLARPV